MRRTSQNIRLIVLENNDPAKVSKNKGTDVRIIKCENCGYVELYWKISRAEPERK